MKDFRSKKWQKLHNQNAIEKREVIAGSDDFLKSRLILYNPKKWSKN
jgi:hypothetical protein